MDQDTNVSTATPAAGTTSAENTGATTGAPQASAPENNTADNGNPADGGAGNAKPSKDGLPAGVKKRLWEQSEKIRNLEAELKKFSEKKPEAPAPGGQQPSEVTPFDDPEKWAAGLKDKVLSEAEQRILTRIQQAEAEKKIVAEAEKAQELILSKPEFGNEESLAEIQAIVASPEVQSICRTSPMKGAEYAMFLWNKAKGLDKESVDKANKNAAQSGAPLPGSSSGGGKKTWTAAEVANYLKDYSSPDWAKKRAEIDLALKEGRIKGG